MPVGRGCTRGKQVIDKASLLYCKASPLGIAVLGVLVVLLITGHIGPSRQRSAQARSRARPHEYMYLDSARVNSYLGQVDGGELISENLQETTSSNSKLGLEGDTVGAAISTGEQLVKSTVVTKSEADRFSDLLSALEAKRPQRWLTTLNARKWCQFTHALNGRVTPDGSIVLIRNVSVQVPPYMSAYPELRYASFRLLPPPQPRKKHGQGRRHSKGQPAEEVFGPAQLTEFSVVDESVRGTPKREQARFKKLVGKNPRIPFSFTVAPSGPQCPKQPEAETMEELEDREESEEAGTEDLRESEARPGASKILEPKGSESNIKAARKAKGTVAASEASRKDEPVTILLPARFANLTGDPSLLSVPLTIVGKIVDNDFDGFGDGTSVSSYWPALSTAKEPLLRELGVQGRYLRMSRVAQRKHLFHALERSLTYEGHVVEIVPIAMYD